MGVVVEFKGIQLEVRTKEANHYRPHCHAVAAGAEASIALDDCGVLASSGFNGPTLNEIVKQVRLYQFALMEEWRRLHGQR